MAATAAAFIPDVAQGEEVGQVPGEHHGDGGDDPRVHGPEHGPPPQETHEGGEGLPEVGVHAAALREGGGQLGRDQSPEEGEDSGHQPDQGGPGEGGDRPGDLRGLDEDGCPDDDPHHHGGGVVEADVLFQFAVSSGAHSEEPLGFGGRVGAGPGAPCRVGL